MCNVLILDAGLSIIWFVTTGIGQRLLLEAAFCQVALGCWVARAWLERRLGVPILNAGIKCLACCAINLADDVHIGCLSTVSIACKLLFVFFGSIFAFFDIARRSGSSTMVHCSSLILPASP